MADINLESQSPVALGANDAAIVRRGTGGVDTAPFTAELVQLGTLATQSGTFSGTSSGTNTGDQTSIVGITGTKAQFDTAVTDGNFLYVGDVTSNATHTGDATGDTALTLATVNANVGAFGSATQVATFTVNGKGLTTAAGNTSIAIPASAVTDFSEAVDDRVAALVVAGTNMTVTYNDVSNTLTFDAAGGGATNLSYTAATRVIASDTGTDATLPLVTSGDAGLAPASGGGTSNFLRADGTWAAPGGGGTPGGSSGEVQYNNAGAFAGAADVEIEGGQLRFPAITTPTAPAADGVKMFGRILGNYPHPHFRGPEDAAAYPLQAALAEGNFYQWSPATGTAASVWGWPAASVGGTATAVGTTVGSRHLRMRRLDYRVTVAAASAIAHWRINSNQHTVGGANSWEGGFRATMHGGPSTGVAVNSSHRFFMGMTSAAAPTDVDPSTKILVIGIGYDDTDTEVQFLHNDAAGSCTKIALGASFPKPTVDNTSTYRLRMFSPPGSTQKLYYEVTQLENDAVATGVVTTDLPTTSSVLGPQIYASVGGVSNVIGICVGTITIHGEPT